MGILGVMTETMHMMNVMLLASAVLALVACGMAAKLLLLREASRLWRCAGAILMASMAATVCFAAMLACWTPTAIHLSVFYGCYMATILISLSMFGELCAHDTERVYSMD